MPLLVEDVEIVVIEREVHGSEEDVNIKSQSLQLLYGSVVVMRIHCTGGVTGEIMSIGPGMALGYELDRFIKPFLIGKDVSHREAIWHEMWDAKRLWMANPWIISLTDIALWDAYAKSFEVPLYQLLGGYRDKLPVYGSSFTLPTIEDFVAQALDYKGRGFPAYKLHVYGDADLDIDLCTAVREAVGPKYPLMVDAVSAYTFTDALRVGRVLGDLDYAWFEEPLRDYLVPNYRELCRQLEVPVMAGEMHEGMHYSQADYIASGATDIVRADVLVKGGIGPVMKTAGMAEAFGLNVEIHTFANPMIDIANLHCAAAIKNTTWFEQLIPRDLVTFGVKENFLIDDEGYVHVPQKPGLGLELDWEFVEKNAVMRF
jgi:L-alanine-DL-glutamate epimerase-like enolase superfamily enzyme